MISVGIYTTEVVPIYQHGSLELAPALVPFIDRYGVWMAYAPAVERGHFRCYVGARFDRVKEAPIGRFNRDVLLVSFESAAELKKVWGLFEVSNLKKLFAEAGLYMEEPEDDGELADEALFQVYSRVMSYLKGLSSSPPSDLLKIPYEEARVRGFTDVSYPCPLRRYAFLGAVFAVLKEFSSASCVPDSLIGALNAAAEIEGSISYPLLVYSQRGAPVLGGLWFPTGGM